MGAKYLHIVAFDNVYPATYGGAIDVYYRIKALSLSGINIILHTTYKGQLHRYSELESLCLHTYYYKRNLSFLNQLHVLPYAVLTRKNSDLLNDLLADDYPILFEGLVTCLYLNHPALSNRVKLFRECNVEHDYYRQLALATRSLYKKIYYALESRKLRRFESVVSSAHAIFALSHGDEQHFSVTYPNVSTIYVPCFHAFDSVKSRVGSSDYILYHGNLGVPENELAVEYICSKVVPLLSDTQIIVAGSRPSARLRNIISRCPSVRLVADPDEQQLNILIQNAHIHLLYTHQATGLKLKLLNVLFQGRHVVCNSMMVAGTELSELCNLSDTPEGIASLCCQLMAKPFSDSDISVRSQVLDAHFNNRNLADQIIRYI